MLTTGQEFLGCMKEKMSVVLRLIAPNRTSEINFGRFLRNSRVSINGIKAAFKDNSGQLNKICSNRHILLVQDTSELSFGLEPHNTGLSKVGNGAEDGFYLHPVLALDASDGSCLGLGETEVYKRIVYDQGDPMNDYQYRHKEAQKLPFSTKESYRWYSAIERP